VLDPVVGRGLDAGRDVEHDDPDGVGRQEAAARRRRGQHERGHGCAHERQRERQAGPPRVPRRGVE
jgi:hypothetical protein